MAFAVAVVCNRNVNDACGPTTKGIYFGIVLLCVALLVVWFRRRR